MNGGKLLLILRSRKNKDPKIIVKQISDSSDVAKLSPSLSNYIAEFGYCRGRRVCVKSFNLSSTLRITSETVYSSNTRKGQVMDEEMAQQGTILKFENPTLRDGIYELATVKHSNIARLMNVSVKELSLTAAFEYCGNGHLEDVFAKQRISLHMNLRILLANGLLNGLRYIHESTFSSHGSLNCRNCYIDDSWNLKISGFGLSFAAPKSQGFVEQLFVAPESMQKFPNLDSGTKPGDIYR